MADTVNLRYDKNTVTVQSNLQNATHFVGVAYPPNKISKTGLKMQAFSACFMKFCLSLNSCIQIEIAEDAGSNKVS